MNNNQIVDDLLAYLKLYEQPQPESRLGPRFTEDVYQEYQDKFDKHIQNGDRAFIYRSKAKTPNSTAVVTFIETYPRFARGYVVNKLSGVKIPYTLNFCNLITKDVYNPESCWSDGSSLWE